MFSLAETDSKVSSKFHNFIDAFKDKLRDLEEQPDVCSNILSMDQEVPEVRSYMEQGDIKSIVKQEVHDSLDEAPATMDGVCESIAHTPNNTCFNSIGTPSSTILLHSSAIPLTVQDAIHGSKTISSTIPRCPTPIVTSSAPFLSSASVHLSAFQNTNSLSNISTIEQSVSLTSGLHVGSTRAISTPIQIPTVATDFLCSSEESISPASNNFLTEDNPPSMCVPEGGLDLLDLDKQTMSFYEEGKPGPGFFKLGTLPMSSIDVEDIEEFAMFAQRTIHSDCDSLNIPRDPMVWTVDNVKTWVRSVCHKKEVQDISAQIGYNGRTLCSFSTGQLITCYGDSGDCIVKELELIKAVKAANYPINGYPVPFTSQMDNQYQVHQTHFLTYTDTPNTGTGISMSPSPACVSPAPSSSCSSQDCHVSGYSGLSDHSDDDEATYAYPPKATNVRRDNKPSASTPRTGRGHKTTIHLWEFLRELLLSDEDHGGCIRWVDRAAGIFKIENSKRVAFLWGKRKNRPAMNYDKLSRSVRQYYKKGIIKKTAQSKRLVYQFCAGYI